MGAGLRAGGEERRGEGAPGCHALGADTRLRLGARVEDTSSFPPPDVPADPLVSVWGSVKLTTQLSPAADAARSSKTRASGAPASEAEDGRVGRRPSQRHPEPWRWTQAGGRASLPGSVQTARAPRVARGPALPAWSSQSSCSASSGESAHARESGGHGCGLGAGQPGHS